jgi:hypothetical protein
MTYNTQGNPPYAKLQKEIKNVAFAVRGQLLTAWAMAGLSKAERQKNKQGV